MTKKNDDKKEDKQNKESSEPRVKHVSEWTQEDLEEALEANRDDLEELYGERPTRRS